MLLPFLIYQEEIGGSRSVIELSLSENVELIFLLFYCQDIDRNIVVLFKNADLTEGEGKF